MTNRRNFMLITPASHPHYKQKNQYFMLIRRQT